jgi:hypothetical protein
MSEEALRLLKEIAKKCKAERSPYVPTAYFKHIPDYKKNLKALKKRGLIFVYKAGEAIGISRKGLETLQACKRK